MCLQNILTGEGYSERKLMAKAIPGHIKKAFRTIERIAPVIDVIIELLDARMPLSSRVGDFVSRLGKKTVVALGKADLAEPEANRQWVEYFRKHGSPCLLLDSRSKKAAKDVTRAVNSLFESSSETGRKSIYRLMVIGIPNVGKSTLVNALAGRKAARTGDLPGVTRDLQWIKLSGKLELLDLPGILDYSLLNLGDQLRMIHSLPGKDEDPFDRAGILYRFLETIDRATVLPGYKGQDSSFSTFLNDYSNRMNFVRKGGEPDLYRSASDIIKRFHSGLFGPISLETPDRLLQNPTEEEPE